MLAATMVLVGVAPAQAAGPAVLSLEVTPVHPTTGAVITTAGTGQNNNSVAYRVAYSCSTATCTGATVTLPATQVDPTWGSQRLLEYSTWTPPAGGGTITGSAATGLTVALGDVPAGTSSTFTVVYAFAADIGYTLVAPAAYFPPGFQIAQSATIASPNATTSVTDAAPPVTWQTTIPTPSIVKVGPTSVRPDTDVTYTIRMASGCFVSGGSGRIVASGAFLCAESFEVVDQLPAEAVFVSATGSGVYDAGTHTVRWATSGVTAAGGWGSSAASGWTNRGPYMPRTVTVNYPASAFPEAAGGADFVEPVTNAATVTVTYLDDAATVKTASSSVTHNVVRVTPFGRATQAKETTYDFTSGGRRYVNVPPSTVGLVCPPSGTDDWARTCTPGQPVATFATSVGHYWYVDTYNRGNVAGVATVIDDQLAATAVRVRAITTSATTPAAKIAYTITNGTTTTSGTATSSYSVPNGSWLTAATVTSGSLAGPNLLPSGNAGTLFRVNYFYNLPVGTPLVDWTNTASATMSYPDNPEISDQTASSERTVTLRELPKATLTPVFAASVVSATVAGGGQAVPGSAVSFVVRGATASIPADELVSPQYVFIAPAGWELRSGSASFAAGAVPPGVAFVYRNVTVGGVTRQAVVASWPTGTTFGNNVTWPNMTVVASPTFAVVAGTNSVANFWAGDSLNQYPPTGPNWGTGVLDAPDVDADGDTAEAFSSASTTIAVSGSARLDIIKEICIPDGADCRWVSNPDIIAGVNPSATDITYRVTFRNGGNTVLDDVIGYDVLPWIGDARGSTFSQTLNAVTVQTSGLALTYSNDTNPCRTEVLATNPGCAPGWGAAASGAQAFRAELDSTLQPGASASLTYTANVVPGAPAGAVACNSVAADTDSTVPVEPRPVCATTQEADLAIEVPDRLPLQAGRPGVVPFTVTNLGASQSAPATVEIEVPAGIRITSLAPAGWRCTSSATAPDGSVTGPVTLSCDAVTSAGTARSIGQNVPDALDLPAVIPDDALIGLDTCFPAVVSGLMFDPVTANNDDAACFSVLEGDSLLEIVKDDGLDEVRIGDEITYTLVIANKLVGESLDGAVVTDALPAYLEFVSASGGGTVSGQGTPDGAGALPGGTVTWTLPSLSAAGVPGDGDGGSGAVGSSTTVTLTARVLQSAETLEEISNTASAEAVDPASPDVLLTDSDSDTDDLTRLAAIQLVKTADPVVFSAVGETVDYSFLVTNSGDVTLAGVTVDETAFTGAGSVVITCPAGAASLAPQATVTCTASYDITQDDLDTGFVSNTATATGSAPTGLTDPVSTPSTALVSADAEADLSVVKTASPAVATAAGDEIEYSFLVTNEGNVTVTDVEIIETAFSGDDDELSTIVCPVGAGSLAPSAAVTCTATYTVTQDDVDAGTISNTATATGEAPGALTDPVSPPSTALVNVPAGAALTLVKSITGTQPDFAGETLTYSFLVTNSGNVTIANISIDEGAFTGAGSAVAITCPATSLAPTLSMTCVGTYDLVQADVDGGGVENTAAAVGTAPNGAVVESDESSADLGIVAVTGLSMVKSATPTTLTVDDDVTYSFVVTNTGNVTVTGITITETAFTGSAAMSAIVCAPGAASLAPDAQVICSSTYLVTQDDVDSGSLQNTAVAAGTAPGGPVTSSSSTVTLPFAPAPAISLDKSADVTGFSVLGQTIEYRFRVTNTGNVTMSAVEIVEGSFSGTGTLSALTCSATSLLPGQFVDCTADYAVTQADIDAGELENTATAEALAPAAGAVTVSSASTVRIPFTGTMVLSLVKTGLGVDVNQDGRVSVGDRIRWTFVATNDGVATLDDLEISDPTAGAVTCDATTLAPGESVDCAAAEQLITVEDARTRLVVNVASALTLGAGGAPVASGQASASVAVVPQPLAVTGSEILSTALVAMLALMGGLIALWFSGTRRRRAYA